MASSLAASARSAGELDEVITITLSDEHFELAFIFPKTAIPLYFDRFRFRSNRSDTSSVPFLHPSENQVPALHRNPPEALIPNWRPTTPS